MLLAEAVAFFSANKGFTRLLKGMIQKYQSLGRWGGSVTLTSLKAEEREALSTFFRQDFSRQNSMTVSLERFAQALEGTRYSEIPVLILLEEVHGGPLTSHVETLAQKEQDKKRYFEKFTSEFTDDYCQSWLWAIQEKDPGTRLIHQSYERAPDLLHRQMWHVLSALRKLSQRSSQELYRLPIFARKITKDPHGFDPDTEKGRLLINALKVIGKEQSGGVNSLRIQPLSPLTHAEELTELYYSFGLLRDDLWNFVTCTGILATSGEHQPVGYLLEAYRERVTLNLPLREVVKIAKVVSKNILPVGGQQYKVFIVENSGVLSALLDYLEEYRREINHQELPNPSLICTHGQFKLASLLLLEKLAASGATLYYSGDFDPEGLAMVDRLIQRFPGQVIPWHYALEDYHVSLSDQQVSPTRLKKLDGILSPELMPLNEEILRTGLVGYQEGILENLWEDVRTSIETSPLSKYNMQEQLNKILFS